LLLQNLKDIFALNFSKSKMQLIIFTAVAFLLGFGMAWVLQLFNISKIKKASKSIEGFLESERLMKDKLQKENAFLQMSKQATETELHKKLDEAQLLTKQMDEDILLLQKSNEETEILLQNSEPALHELKIKLIEANNTIARLKSQLSKN